MRCFLKIAFGVSFVFINLPSGVLFGQAGSSDPARTDNEIEQLKQAVRALEATVRSQQTRIEELEKQRGNSEVVSTRPAAAASEPAAPKVAGAVVSGRSPASAASSAQAGWVNNRLIFRSADGSSETVINGLGQLDARVYGEGNHPPNSFFLRRARLGVQGQLLSRFEYKIEGDFADTKSTLLRDIYGGVKFHDAFKLRFGQFREPISQERLQSSNALDFVERSLVYNIVPDRSPGIMALGSASAGKFEYQLGVFNGRGLLAANDDNTPEGAARVRVSPWRENGSFLTRGLAFGGAVTYGNVTGGRSVVGLTESRSFIFYAPDPVNGPITRANAELTWMLGPAAIRTEYVQSNEARQGLGDGGTDLPGIVGKAYMGQVTWLLTGENKPENGLLTPRAGLFQEGGPRAFGAWELKFRYSNLLISDGGAKTNRSDSYLFGVNWYMNRFVKQVVDIGWERFSDPLRSPAADGDFFVVLSRLQVAF